MWLNNEINELKKLNNLEIKTRTSVAAYHGYNYLLARENLTDHLSKNEKKNKIRQRLLKIRAKKVIVATGSLERPLIFNNNDRPGIMLSSAMSKSMQITMVLFVVKKMFSLLTMTTAYESVQYRYLKKGIKVKAIIDIREKSESSIS